MRSKKLLTANLRVLTAAAALMFVCACSSKQVPPAIEYYPTAFRQLPPEPVYNRVTLIQPPQPMPPRAGVESENVPYLLQVMSFEMKDATLAEALGAVGQTLGYRTEQVPAMVNERRFSLKFSGTVDEIVAAIGRRAGVTAELDHEQRLVRVVDGGIVPRLDASTQ